MPRQRLPRRRRRRQLRSIGVPHADAHRLYDVPREQRNAAPADRRTLGPRGLLQHLSRRPCGDHRERPGPRKRRRVHAHRLQRPSRAPRRLARRRSPRRRTCVRTPRRSTAPTRIAMALRPRSRQPHRTDPVQWLPAPRPPPRITRLGPRRLFDRHVHNVPSVSVGPTHVNGVVDVTVTSCTTCHGSNGHANPPLSLDGSTDPTTVGVGAHEAHLDPSDPNRIVALPLLCNDCHAVPTAVVQPGHFNGPQAIVRFPFGGTYDPTSATCNVWCHFNKTPGP